MTYNFTRYCLRLFAVVSFGIWHVDRPDKTEEPSYVASFGLVKKQFECSSRAQAYDMVRGMADSSSFPELKDLTLYCVQCAI